MEITIERVGGIGVQVIEQMGEKFYCLSDIMEHTATKPSIRNGFKKNPINISGRIVWGSRMVDVNNYIESIFVDGCCMMDILAEYPVRASQG